MIHPGPVFVRSVPEEKRVNRRICDRFVADWIKVGWECRTVVIWVVDGGPDQIRPLSTIPSQNEEWLEGCSLVHRKLCEKYINTRRTVVALIFLLVVCAHSL